MREHTTRNAYKPSYRYNKNNNKSSQSLCAHSVCVCVYGRWRVDFFVRNWTGKTTPHSYLPKAHTKL